MFLLVEEPVYRPHEYVGHVFVLVKKVGKGGVGEALLE